MYYAIHIAAPNDRNGNPRRAFLVYDEGGALIGVADEGYKGTRAISDQLKSGDAYVDLPGGCTVQVLARVDTTASYYRRALKRGTV